MTVLRYELDDATRELVDRVLWYALDTADMQRDDRTRDHMIQEINAVAYTLGLVDDDGFVDPEPAPEPTKRFTLVVDNERDPK